MNDFLYYEHRFDEYRKALEFCKDLGYGVGYADQDILDAVIESTNKVIMGKAVYEQDGVAYYKEHNNYELLFSLFYIFSIENRLNVLDMGGALGSTYLRYKNILPDKTKWSVVEQKHYVDYGRLNIQNISFYYDLDDCLKNNINVILLSSIFQYLETPYDFIKQVCEYHVPYLIIDETAFVKALEEGFFIQHIPSCFYKKEKCYPAFVFNRDKFISSFEKNGYRKRFEWKYDGTGVGIPIVNQRERIETTNKGFLFSRVDQSSSK